jgi:hypothetical protein
MKYKRLCVGLNDSGQLVPKNEVNLRIKDYSKDHYISLFDYNEDHLADFIEKGSVAGVTDVTTNVLIWDFDNIADLEKSRADAVELCSRLASHGIKADEMVAAFSGKKGFTVEVHSTTELAPGEVKRICLNLGHGLQTLDNQIYNASRIIRVYFTKHQDSGLYKIPLTINELAELPLDTIKAMAEKSESNVEHFAQDVEVPPAILALKDKDAEVVVEADNEVHDLDMSLKPKHLPACKYAIMNGIFRPGNRSQALMALAAHFKAQGYPKEVNYRLLKGARELNERRHPSTEGSDTANKEYIWNNIIEQVYSPNWKGATYACKDHAFLQQSCPVKGTSKCGINKKEPIVTIGEVSSVFRNYATNIDKNTISLGISVIDKQIRLQSNSHAVIAGSSGSGKTGLVLNILNNTSQAGLRSVFFSMDMSAALIYQKLAHKVSGLDDKKLYAMYQQKREKEIAVIDKNIAEAYKNVLFDFRSGVSIDDLRENVLRLKEQQGDSMKLVVLDFINRLRGPYADETSNLAYIAPRLADLANESETLVISLAQTSRAKGGPGVVLTDSRIAKGSSAIEESASVLLGVYREGYNTDQDKFLTIAALKTRMGKEFVQPLYWNGLTGEIRELSTEEDFELNQLQERKKNEKASNYD